jgi:hypothetical protein
MCFSPRNLFWALIAGLLLSAVASAQVKDPQPPECTAEMLDINLLTQPDSAPGSGGHLLAVELRNRSQKSCLLVWLGIRFPPEDDYDQTGNPWPPDPSPTALAFKRKSNHLEAGETVHFLLAWSSMPLTTDGIAMNDCATHDTMTLSSTNPGPQKPLLEVRHFEMQACGEVYRSGYRLGPYVAREFVGKEWLDRRQLKTSDLPDQVLSEPQEMTATPLPAVNLRTLYDTEYLPGTFESGYSGYFELFLKVPSPAFSNCLFESLRKREADGHTVIYLNHCQNRNLGPGPAVREMRLPVSNFGLRPAKTGRVEYEARSAVQSNGGVALARSQVELAIRDPRQPMLPAIDTGTPGCLASQLKLSPPVELGSHWAQPRTPPPPGEEWHDGKVFEVTNVSSATCMLGGVPQLRFLHPPEVTTGFLSLPVCRNCGTPLFQPRESRWIDLRPNDSAHFMMARTVFDPGYWFLCTVIGGLEMTLPGDQQPIHLPFDAISCGPQVRVSAWRTGRYDGDPMNTVYDRQQKERLEQRAAAAGPLPKKCAESVSPDTGQPVMFPSQGPLTWGISSQPTHYGEPLPVLLWLDNPTDKPQPVWTCASIDGFWISGIDVFDSAGHRVLSLNEEKQKKVGAPVMEMLSGCSRNFPIDIPAHTCAHTDFSSFEYDFSRDLRSYFDLSPGQYFIVAGERTRDGKPVSRTLLDPRIGLAVTVQEP